MSAELVNVVAVDSWEEYPRVQLSAGYISYRFQGPERGKVVVCCHGIMGNKHQFDDISTPLSTLGFRVLTFDYYGRGNSDVPDLTSNTLCTDFYVTMLHELVHALKLHESPFLMIGYSLGGCISTVFTSRYPSFVSALVMISPAGIGESTLAERFLRVPVVGLYISRKIFPAVYPRSVTGGFKNPSQCPQQVAKCKARVQRHLQKPGFVDCILQTIKDFNFWNQHEAFEQAGKTGVPALIIWGELDRTCLPKYAPKVANYFAASGRLRVLKDTGHAVIYEKSEQVLQSILEFFIALDLFE
eukprot:GILI01006087.1.p1 GENE.GILI01006087.1~~GILI01006087.1.p1  ORF type:complete len:300 (+),score=10.78 GILI01006087.1:175-1074(+)